MEQIQRGRGDGGDSGFWVWCTIYLAGRDEICIAVGLPGELHDTINCISYSKYEVNVVYPRNG